MEKSFTKSGKTFHKRRGYAEASFPEAIAKAMAAEFGVSPTALRTVAKLTSASERTVRNWFEGTNGPSGENLVTLMRHSDEVLRTTLVLAGRTAPDGDARLANVRRQLVAVLENLDRHP